MQFRVTRQVFKLVPTRWRGHFPSGYENHSSLHQNVGRTLMKLTNGILNGNKVSSFNRSIFIVEFIKSLKVICVPMNAIEAGICSFDQSVKQIVENDFEVDFKGSSGC